MVGILNTLLPNKLYRKDLVRLARLLPDYATEKKAEALISNQIFRLTKHNYLESVRGNRGLWYEPSLQLLMLLKDVRGDRFDKGINLEKEESQIKSELALYLAELEGFRELSKKHPMLKRDIDELIATENEHVTTLHGKLSALKKLRIFVLDSRKPRV